MDPLHPYQVWAIKEALDRKHNFEAIDMGLGKTRIMLEVQKQLQLGAFVIAPYRVALRTWPAEINKWVPGTTWHFLHGRDKALLYHSKRKVDFKLINYDGLKWLVSMIEKYGSNEIKGRILILDESSQIKSYSSVRFKMLKKILHFFPYVYNLSATPLPKSYQDLWSQYYVLDKGAALGRSMDAYRIEHFEMLKKPVWVKGVKKHYIQYSLREGHENKVQKKVAHMTTRLDSEDYIKLPPVTYTNYEVGLGEDVLNIYNQLEKNTVFEFGDNTVTAANTGVLTSKLRQLVQGALYVNDRGEYENFHTAKIEGLKDLLEQANGDPILCPIQFKFELSELRKEFGDDIPAIVGGVPVKTQTRILDDWDRGQLPLLLCHPGALSHGLNLQNGGRIICWYSLTWDLEQYRQLNGRIARQGQKRPVLITHIIANGTIDERVVSVLNDKEATQKDFLKAMKQYLSK